MAAIDASKSDKETGSVAAVVGAMKHRCKKGWNAGTMFPEII